MAFHTYSYIQLGPKYPFIATLSRPFFKFSLNNSLIPLAFVVNLCISIYYFQKSQEFVSTATLFSFIASFVVGVFLFISFRNRPYRRCGLKTSVVDSAPQRFTVES